MKKVLLGLSILFVLCFAGICSAIDDFTVTEAPVYDEATNTITVVVNDNRGSGQAANAASASINGTALSNVTFQAINESDIPVTYVFVVDTTTTAYSDQKNRPAEIAQALSNGRSGKNDLYYLISFDTKVNEPVGPSPFYDEVFDKLSYDTAGMSDYSEALRQAVNLLKGINILSKKVIILVSDGYQVSDPALEQRELIDMIEESGFPVYSCGLLQSQTGQYMAADLQKLSNISQGTGGMFFSFESNKNPGKDILNHITKSGVVKASITDTASVSRSEQSAIDIRLLRNDSEIGKVTAQAEISVPETEDICKSNPNDPSCKQEPISTSDKIKGWLFDNFGPNYILIVIACFLLIALVILIILTIVRSKKTDNDDDFEELPVNEENKGCTIILKDLNNGKQYTAEIPNGERRIFGRSDDEANGVIGLGGDQHISRRQFILTVNDNVVVLEDDKSQNGTYLNGTRIRGKTGIQNGSQIRIGEIAGEREFSVTIKQN